MTQEQMTAIYEALGEASMCWNETPKGVFDSTKAKEIGDRLIKLLTPPAPAGGEEYPNNYVCGFLFDKEVQNVVLIWKEKPAWQKGKLNGVGGKIESGETPLKAMIREFKEETGLHVENWQPLADVNGDDWCVHFFFAQDDKNQFEYAETMEKEEVAKMEIDILDDYDQIPNLRWLIPMAVARIKTPGENITAGSRWRGERGESSIPYYLDNALKDWVKAHDEFSSGYINKDGVKTRCDIAALSVACNQADTSLRKCYTHAKLDSRKKSLDEQLIELGYDPKEVEKRGLTLIKKLKQDAGLQPAPPAPAEGEYVPGTSPYDGVSMPITSPNPTCGARWVRATTDTVFTDRTVARFIHTKTPLCVPESWVEQHPETIDLIEVLDESPCTCQRGYSYELLENAHCTGYIDGGKYERDEETTAEKSWKQFCSDNSIPYVEKDWSKDIAVTLKPLPFPSREEAEKWAKDFNKHYGSQNTIVAALAMYDWIAERINK